MPETVHSSAKTSDDIHSLNQRGVLAFQAGDFASAAKFFSAAANTLNGGIGLVEQRTVAELVNRNLQVAAQSAGDWGLVSQALQRLVKLSPNDVGAWALLNNIVRTDIAARLQAAETSSGNFVTSHIRPKEAVAMGLLPDINPDHKVVVVLQGPLLLANDFTLETIKLYRKIFPRVDLVVSTWVGEDGAALQALRDVGAGVVLSDKPTVAGNGNVNMQLVSAHAGIAYARTLGCDYILKSRTDYRIYNPRFFLNALGLLGAFPLNEKSGGRQENRIMVFDDMNLYRIYTVHDRNMFGLASDISHYWDAPIDLRTNLGPGESPLDLARAGVCESYYLVRYMELLGRSLHWTLEDYWNILKDHFIVMDHSAADMYWCKHDRHNEYRMRLYSFDSNFAILGFHEWLRMTQGRWPFVGDGRISERKSGASITDILADRYDQGLHDQ